MSTLQYTYFFGSDGTSNLTEGQAEMKNLLGGKGANLAEMSKLGLQVPQGFTITTEVCNYFYSNEKQYPKELKSQVESSVKKVEKVRSREFGSNENPLLLSVRSGARPMFPVLRMC